MQAGGTGASTAAGARTNLELGGKWRLDATAAPTVNDDTGDGYSVGSGWVDVTNGRVHFAVNVASAAAVWRDLVFQTDNIVSVAAAPTKDRHGLYCGLDIHLTAQNLNYTSNIWFDATGGAWKSFEAGYGARIQPATSSGDFIVSMTTASASAGDESVTLQNILQFDRSLNSGAGAYVLTDINGDSVLTIHNGSVVSPGAYSATTASAANVFVTPGGALQRSTSSLKYKTDVEPIDINYAKNLLALDGIYYRSTCEGDPEDWTFWGFGAEDVAAVDPRLVHWGEDGPESVQYERFVPHHHALIKDLYARLEGVEAPTTTPDPDRVAALEARIADYEERLATLEAALNTFDTIGESENG